MARTKNTTAAPKSVLSGSNTGLVIGGGAGASKLSALSDVTLGTQEPHDKSLLMFDVTDKKWHPNYTQYASKAFVDAQLDAIVTGLSHGMAVISIVSAPPLNPSTGDYYIVGDNPTGAFAGHHNSIAHWAVHIVPDQPVTNRWEFAVPRDGETHLVEELQANYTWSQQKWIKVATSVTAPKTISRTHMATFSDAGQPVILDLGSDSWTRAEIRGQVRCTAAPTHVLFSPKTSDSRDAVVFGNLLDFYSSIRYQNSFEVKYTGNNNIMQVNNCSVSWLAPNLIAADRMSTDTMALGDLRLDFQWTYDRYLVVTLAFVYWAYSGKHYEVATTFKFNQLTEDKKIQRVVFYPATPTARILFNGQSTVYQG